MMRNNIRESAFEGNFEVSNLLYSNSEIIAMTAPFSKNFKDTYKKAFDYYIQGKWQAARVEFENTIGILDKIDPTLKDNLSINLLKYMQSFNYEAPKDWEGYKDCDE